MEIKSLLKLEKIKAGNLKKKKSRFIFEKINIYFILINIIFNSKLIANIFINFKNNIII